MPDTTDQWLIREAYAAHCILTNLGFEPAEVFVECRNIINGNPPGPHVVVRLQRGDLRFILHLHPVTKKEGKRFARAWQAFVDAKNGRRISTDELDRWVRSSQVYAQRVDLLCGLTRKGFELRPGEMVN
jgi:hypothetical protein